jgi:hypothetical protein
MEGKGRVVLEARKKVCVKCRRGEEGWCWKLDRSRVDLRACRGRKVMIMKMRQRGSGSRSDF